MLQEAVGIMRALFEGETVTWRGQHYQVENAHLYTRPQRPVPIYMSAFGPKAAAVAGRIADGFVCTKPDAELVQAYRDAGGVGPAQGGLKACYAPQREQARHMVHRIWPNHGLPGEQSQILPTPAHFQQASSIVTEEQATGGIPCGNDPDDHAAAITAFVDADYDEVYVSQVGPTSPDFFAFYGEQVLPALRSHHGEAGVNGSLPRAASTT